MHRANQVQSGKFNSELMKKMVLEKRKNNHKFTSGKCMNDAFKYYQNKNEKSKVLNAAAHPLLQKTISKVESKLPEEPQTP